ncbi:MAG: tetratricopeptide repeat protein, partial [Planctomycetota bacterium]
KVEIATRAHFNLGKTYFNLREFEKAREAYRQVMASIEAELAANSNLGVWQARAGLESARCSQIMANQSPNRSQQRAHAEEMAKSLQFVIKNFPESAEAKAARRQLERLRTALDATGDTATVAR